MRSAALLLLVTLSAACAAPAAEDADTDETAGASTANGTTAAVAEMQKFFTSAEFKIGREIRFSGEQAVDVGTADPTYGGCAAVLKAPAPDAVVPAGDVYKVDAKAISITRVKGVLYWKIPLRDEKVQVGKKGAASDFYFWCGGTYSGDPMRGDIIAYDLRNGFLDITGPNVKFFN